MKTMTQEDKELLLMDICARLPYGIVILDEPAKHFGKLLRIDINMLDVYYDGEENEERQTIMNIKPYLRRMSSMTKEERKEWMVFIYAQACVFLASLDKAIDWLNAHHFDYRGLIEKGLALEAPEGMYKTE